MDNSDSGTEMQGDYRLRKLGPFIVAVLSGENSRKLEFEGTAFVLSYRDKLFLITAAHTLSVFSNQKQPRVGFQDRVCALNVDRIIKTKSDDSDISNLDLGVLVVSNDCEHFEALREISLSPENLKTDNSDLEYKQLAIVGYPVKSNSRVTSRDSEYVKGTVVGHFYHHDPEFDLSLVGCTPSRHVAISWPEKDSEGNKTQIPVGLSGAPVWAIVGDQKTEHGIVVGVFISHHGKHKVGVYTNIQLLLQLVDAQEQLWS